MGKVKFFGILALTAIIGFSLSSCDDADKNQTPVAGDYIFDNLEQIAGSVTAVTITAKEDKSPGAVINVQYNGKTAVPQLPGTYTVRFNVAPAKGWNGVRLSAGNLIVEPIFNIENPNFGNNVSVHDPSIFKDDDGTYYTFGSHFAVARSTNLMSWTQVAADNQSHRLYGGANASDSPWKTVLAAAFAHVGNGSDGNPPGSTWAPDVIKINGKYYMYYSLSTWGSSKSYIGRVEADSVLGPYTNSVEVVKTPASNWPNAIDPAVFYSNDRRLWMSYGSFWGGIYMLELETSGERMGLPKPGQGYGKRIWVEGGDTGPEGPYIFYNQNTGYYYLMVSYGSLSDTYNMRVARSENPDGPYRDILGREMTSTASTGNKLAGNYKFEGASRGYAALGHNSVLVENGLYFVVYHTRYQNGSGGVTGNHNQFVNQLFFNSGGWPVMSPNRYAGETARTVDRSDVAGDYDVVVHTSGSSVTFVNSVLYTLTDEGQVMLNGTPSGSWELTGSYYLRITINSIAYNGVIVYQYNNDRGYAELSFTGVSDQGNSMWANKRPAN